MEQEKYGVAMAAFRAFGSGLVDIPKKTEEQPNDSKQNEHPRKEANMVAAARHLLGGLLDENP